MPEPAIDTTPDVETETVGSETDSPTTETTETPDAEQDTPNREAAKYRKRAQAAEAERDRLTEQLTALQRAEVERLAAAHLHDGADVWRDGATLTDVLTDDGTIDTDKVTQLTQGLLATHRHWRKAPPSAVPASTVTGDGKIGSGDTKPTFVDAFSPRKA